MIGTWVNVAGIVVGALVGLLLKRGIPKKLNEAVLKVEGVAITLIGLGGVLSAMLRADPVTGAIDSSGGLALLISLVVGCIIGELLKLDERINAFGLWVEAKAGPRGEGFAKGFVSASLIFSVGAMSVIGPLEDGLRGDSSILFIKTMLDGTTSIILTSTLGFGVLFAAVPVLLLQGAVALLAGQIAPFVSDELLAMFSMVGYSIVMCIGLNFLLDAKVKTANLLPALLVAIAYHFLTVWLAGA